jgi:hypothetical protein
MDVTPQEVLSPEVNQAFDALLDAVDQVSASERRLTKSVCSALGSILVACARIVAPKPELPNTDLWFSLGTLHSSWERFALADTDRSFWEGRCNFDEDDYVDPCYDVPDTLAEAADVTRNAICEARKALISQAQELKRQSDEDYHYIGSGRIVREEPAWRYKHWYSDRMCQCRMRAYEDRSRVICVVTSILPYDGLAENVYTKLQLEHPECICIEYKSGWAERHGVDSSFDMITLNEEGKAIRSRFADAVGLFSVG